MPATVVKHQTTDKGALGLGPVLHLHHLHHVQVDRLLRDMDGLDSLHHNRCQLLSHDWVNFGAEGRLSDGLEHLGLVTVGQRDLHTFEHFQGLVLGHLEALSDNSWVEALGNVGVSLLQELSDQKNG